MLVGCVERGAGEKGAFLIECNPTKIWQNTYLKGWECLQKLIRSHCCESFSTHFRESLAS